MAKSRDCSAPPSGPRRTPDELRSKRVAYLNSDTNGRGYLGMEGSHALEKFINGVARDIDDPETQRSACGSGCRPRRSAAESPDERKDARDRARPAHRRARLRLRLSRHSSSTSALPSLNLGYGGEDDGGIYHSIYDDFYWYTHFSDTSFVYAERSRRRRERR